MYASDVLFVLVTLYVFKCLSHFSSVWSTEHMFFKWVCHTPMCVRKVEIGRRTYQQALVIHREILYVCGQPQWRKKNKIPEILDNKCAESHFWCAHTYRKLCEKSWSMEIRSPCVGTENVSFFSYFFLNETPFVPTTIWILCVRVSIQHKYNHNNTMHASIVRSM